MALLNDAQPFCLFEDSRSTPDTEFLRAAGVILEQPQHSITATNLHDVGSALAAAETAAKEGAFVAGFVAYEAASAFDPKMRTATPAQSLPLVYFQVFAKAHELNQAELDTFWHNQALLRPSADLALAQRDLTERAYLANVKAIHDYLRAGDIYQANLTFGLTFESMGHAASLYARLRRSQPAPFSAFLSFGGLRIISLSPERFFQRQGERLIAEPMKGTLSASPGNSAKMLRDDPKNQAENLMITDLLRNDMSRLASRVSVTVAELFKVQRLPSVFQMTSRVEAHIPTETALADIFSALFPCGSVTGAPKLRAMEIINELEAGPRGIYCGAIGLIRPGGDASFAVPIRTMVDDGQATRLHIGSGIVADSIASEEFEECLLKAQFAAQPPLDFSLIETMGLGVGDHGQCNVRLWRQHMLRLEASADALGFIKPDADQLFENVAALGQHLAPGRYRLRLLYDRFGHFNLTGQPFAMPADGQVMILRVGQLPTLDDIEKLRLRHKTTHRWFYDTALRDAKTAGACDDVLLVGEDGCLREGSYTNVFLQSGDVLLTPPDDGSLLPGVLRGSLLETGKAREAMIHMKDVNETSRLYVGNSLRGLMPARIIP